MPIEKEKLEKLKELLALQKVGGSAKDLFLLEKIRESINGIKQELNQELRQLQQSITNVEDTISLAKKKVVIKTEQEINKIKDEQKTLNKATQGDFSDLTVKLNKGMAKALKDQRNSLNFIMDKTRKIKSGGRGKPGGIGNPGQPGKNADEEKIIDKVLKKIEIPEIDESMIKTLKEDIEELKQRPLGRGGGGFSKIHMESKMIDNELVGTGDGSTTEFTLNNTPNPSTPQKIVVGSGELFLTDDYTISGGIITFLTAPPNGAKIRATYRK